MRYPPQPWPWPADTPLERARRVALIYRNTLIEHGLGDVAHHLDRAMVRYGQGWIVPGPAVHAPDDLLTADLAADMMAVSRRTIYAWRERGLTVVSTPDGPRYRVRDVIAFAAEQRRRRIRGSRPRAG